MTSTDGPALRVNRVHFPVTALGPGRRLGLWLQGCPLACAGCMSLDTWDATAGVSMDVGHVVAMWQDAVSAGADGITISGGEPLVQASALTTLLRAVTDGRQAEELDVLLFTGFELDELDEEQRRAALLADVVVSGRYRAGEPTDLIWRGSANQRMHLNTNLGRRRYAPFVGLAPERPPIQVGAEQDGVWLIGVPRPGTLQAVERGLRHGRVPVEAVTWRRPAGDGRPPDGA